MGLGKNKALWASIWQNELTLKCMVYFMYGNLKLE